MGELLLSRAVKGNKHFRGNSNKVEAGRQRESPTSGLCPATLAPLQLPLWPVSIWLCWAAPSSHASQGLVTYSDHLFPPTPPRTICIHNQQLPEEAIPVFIVPSRLHKQCAENATAQWGTGEREKLQCGGNGRETAGGRYFVMVCG